MFAVRAQQLALVAQSPLVQMERGFDGFEHLGAAGMKDELGARMTKPS